MNHFYHFLWLRNVNSFDPYLIYVFYLKQFGPFETISSVFQWIFKKCWHFVYCCLCLILLNHFLAWTLKWFRSSVSGFQNFFSSLVQAEGSISFQRIKVFLSLKPTMLILSNDARLCIVQTYKYANNDELQRVVRRVWVHHYYLLG